MTFWARYYLVCRWLLCLLLAAELAFGRWWQAGVTLAMYFYATYEHRKAKA